MNIERGFRFVFQEKNWLGKVAVGGLIALFSFLIFPLLIYLGYLVEVTKRTIKDEPQLLPDWDNIGQKLANGFKLFVILLVYLVPFFILYFISFMQLTRSEIDGFRSREITALIPMFIEAEFWGFSILLLFLSILYVILFLLILPFVVGKFVESESINDAFAISEIFSMLKNNLGDAVVILLLTVLLQFLASLGVVLCFVGVLFTGFWANVVMYYLYGELYKKILRARATASI